MSSSNPGRVTVPTPAPARVRLVLLLHVLEGGLEVVDSVRIKAQLMHNGNRLVDFVTLHLAFALARTVPAWQTIGFALDLLNYCGQTVVDRHFKRELGAPTRCSQR